MKLTDAIKESLQATARNLSGAERRRFLAQTVQALGRGGQRLAERELGWTRNTIRKGMRELQHGMPCPDGYRRRGRKSAEEHLPNLMEDIAAIVESHAHAVSQASPTSPHSYLTAAEVRRQLIRTKGYRDAELPSERTIRTKLNNLGFAYEPKARFGDDRSRS